MTVSYTERVATCRGLGNFYKLLFRWKGSIYKVIWMEVIIYLICFYLINFFYRFHLIHSCDRKRLFIDMVKYCDSYGKNIPVTFVLGFYVSIVVGRWWNQFLYLPWPDTLALTVSATVDGTDDRGRLIRRTLLRYANVCFVMAISSMSVAGSLRFPTTRHMVEAGLLLEHERLVLEEMNAKTIGLKYWVPIVWAGVVARRAKKEGKIRDDISLNNLITCLNSFRKQTQEMTNYDWVNVPLVYTQVCTLAVYVYFLAALVGKQLAIIVDQDEPADLYFPFFNFLEFFFYFGWLKVAECLINPYGEDDDDFEVNWLIDRDFEVSYVVVDEMHQEHPNLLKDHYWDEVFPLELPYTEGTVKYKNVEGQLGSTRKIHLNQSEAEFVKSEGNIATTTVAWRESKTTQKELQLRGKESLNEFNQQGSLADEFLKGRGKVSIGDTHHSSLALGVAASHTSSSASGFNSKGKGPKKRGTALGGSGYWGEVGQQARPVRVSDLMEKDDVQYDPAASSMGGEDDENKQQEGTENGSTRKSNS